MQKLGKADAHNQHEQLIRPIRRKNQQARSRIRGQRHPSKQQPIIKIFIKMMRKFMILKPFLIFDNLFYF
jgi:hypothetical protein